MNLLSADTLLVEQVWTSSSLLLRSKYRVEVYDERDTLLAVVEETKRALATSLLRKASVSQVTPFALQVVANGQPVLVITKSAGMGKRATKVAWPNGQPVGSIVPEPGRYALLDAAERHLCLLGDVAQIQTGQITKRAGKRVRRDVYQIRPGTAEPVRSLAVAAGVAFDIVRGVGTNHLSSDVSDFFGN